MPKKKPLDKRLKNLFEDVKPEHMPAETTPGPLKRVPTENALRSIEIQPAKWHGSMWSLSLKLIKRIQ